MSSVVCFGVRVVPFVVQGCARIERAGFADVNLSLRRVARTSRGWSRRQREFRADPQTFTERASPLEEFHDYVSNKVRNGRGILVGEPQHLHSVLRSRRALIGRSLPARPSSLRSALNAGRQRRHSTLSSLTTTTPLKLSQHVPPVAYQGCAPRQHPRFLCCPACAV